MESKIINKLLHGGYCLRYSEDRVYDAVAYDRLIHTVLDGATEDQLTALYDCDIDDIDSLNQVIARWSDNGLLPQNTFSKAYSQYTDGEYTKSLTTLLCEIGRVKSNNNIIVNTETVTNMEVEMYTQFIPNNVLLELVFRFLFDPCLVNDETYSQFDYATLELFFNRCRRSGWLNFEPYIKKMGTHVVLVMRYDRLIFFDGECWGIYTTDSSNSAIFKGSKIDKSVWQVDYAEFVHTLMCCSLLSIGTRMLALRRLIIDNCGIVDEFIRETLRSYGLQCEDTRDITSCINAYVKQTYDVQPMHYRIPRDKYTDFAHLYVVSSWKGAIEVSGGIRPQVVYYDFSSIFSRADMPFELYSYISKSNVPAVFICGVLSLFGVMMDDNGVFSPNRESIMNNTAGSNLKDIRSAVELQSILNS